MFILSQSYYSVNVIAPYIPASAPLINLILIAFDILEGIVLDKHPKI